MVRVLFVIHDLGPGGAEKVLVNLVNNMEHNKFDVSVLALFGGGVNERFLSPKVHYKAVFSKAIPGNSKIMKLFTPELLHSLFIKGQYDIEISYLEGPAARVVSGCNNPNTKKIAWMHCTMHSEKELSRAFVNYAEALKCYNRMDVIACVSQEVKSAFLKFTDFASEKVHVVYNTNESDRIQELAKESLDTILGKNVLNWCVVGKLIPVKNQESAIQIQRRLVDNGVRSHLYILGDGPLRRKLEQVCEDIGIGESVTFLGYQTNPYKYVARCDLFVCSSTAEGFSTAATEALIVGTPVVTTLVSGMKEMLGENNEYGIVTDNNEEALYHGIKQLLDNPELLAHYKKQAEIRGKTFSTENTVRAVEDMLTKLLLGE